MNKKIRNPSHFYIANNEGSKIIFDEITTHLKKLGKKPNVFYEINPGTLSLTKLLLDERDMFQKLILIENHENFFAKAEVSSFYIFNINNNGLYSVSVGISFIVPGSS